MASVEVVALAVLHEDERQAVLQDDEIEEQEEEVEALSVEDALHRLEALYKARHEFLREDLLARMEPTIRCALGRVEDDETEFVFHTLAMINLAAHLCGRRVYENLVDALKLLSGPFLTDTNEELPEDDLESALSLLDHLQNRLYPPLPVANLYSRRSFHMNTRTFPFLVAVVAHVVAQTALDWDEVVSMTKHFVQSSFYMDPCIVQVGLALYGLGRLKAGRVLKGLTIELILEDFSQQLTIEILESASGLSRYVVSMYIANQVLVYDEQDDQAYAKNVDALTVFLREAGATHEDAAYRFIDIMNKSHPPDVTIIPMIQQTGGGSRTTVLAPEYALETQIMVFVARDEISAARKIALRMESCSWLCQQAKMNAWSRILNHLRQTGMLLLDGNHSTPWYDRKYQDLTILVMSMGQPLGVDVLCNFFYDFVTEASENEFLTPDEVIYITLASQRTLLLLLRNKFANDERAVKVWLEVFPDLGCFGGNTVEWAEEFLQRRNPIPETLLIEGFIDLNCFQSRCKLALEEAKQEQMIIEDHELPLHQSNSSSRYNDDEHDVISGGNNKDGNDATEDDGDKEPIIEIIDDDDGVETSGDLSDDEIVEVIDDDEYEEVRSDRGDDKMDEDDTEEWETQNQDEINNEEEEVLDEQDELASERDDDDMDEDDTKDLEEGDHSEIKNQKGDYIDVNLEQELPTRDSGGGTRHSDDDIENDGWNDEADEKGSSGGSEESEMRESEESVVDDEYADEGNAVIEILDDEEDEEMNDASGAMRENVQQSDDAAHEADVEHLEDDSDDQYGDDTADEEYLSDARPVNEEAIGDPAMPLGDPRQIKKDRDAVARFEQGYEPDTAGGDISQAELQARLEKGYEPDAGSQVDDQEESGLEEIRQHFEKMEADAQLDQEFVPETASKRLVPTAMQARLEKGYEPDAGSHGHDQGEHGEIMHSKEQKEAQARLEQGYEPDTAGGDISQAEMQDRLDKGYEPDTAAVYTEEEVSEAVPTEEEDNADEEPKRAAAIKINAMSQAQSTALSPTRKALCDQSGALSDDMDAADDRTEVDHGAESSEVEENMSQAHNEAERVIPPAREASSTLVAFAYEAQIAHADMDRELATDLSRNTNDGIFLPPVYRKVKGGYPETSRAIGTPDTRLGQPGAPEYLVGDLGDLSPGKNARMRDGLSDPNCEVDVANAPIEGKADNETTELQVSTSTTSLQNELIVPEAPSMRPAFVDRNFSTVVHLSASEMSEDAGEDEMALAPSFNDAGVMNESEDGWMGVVDSETDRLHAANIPGPTKSPEKGNYYEEEEISEVVAIVDLFPQQAQKPTLNRGLSTAAQAAGPPTTDDDSDVGAVSKTASHPSNDVDSNVGLVGKKSTDYIPNGSEETKEHVLSNSLWKIKEENTGDGDVEVLEDYPEEDEGDSEPQSQYLAKRESRATTRKTPTEFGTKNDEEPVPRRRSRVAKKVDKELLVTRKRPTRSRPTVPGDDEEVQEKPVKRGRSSTKEVTQMQPKKPRRGETIKEEVISDLDDGKLGKDDDKPVRRGDRHSKVKKDEEASMTSRRPSRARGTQLDDNDPDGQAKPQKRGFSALNDEGHMKEALRDKRGGASKSKEVPIELNGDEPFQDDQKPRKRGRTAIEKVADTEPETRRGRGRAEKATPSTKMVKEEKPNEPSPRKTRRSGKATSDETPLTRRSAAVRATSKDSDKEELAVPLEPRTTRGANKVRGRAALVIEEDRTTGNNRITPAVDDDASASTSTRSKRSGFARTTPSEATEVPTRTTRNTKSNLAGDDDASASTSTRSKRSGVARTTPPEATEVPTRTTRNARNNLEVDDDASASTSTRSKRSGVARTTPPEATQGPTHKNRNTRNKLAGDDDASASTSTRSKRSSVARTTPPEATEVPTRRSTRPRKAVNRG